MTQFPHHPPPPAPPSSGQDPSVRYISSVLIVMLRQRGHRLPRGREVTRPLCLCVCVSTPHPHHHTTTTTSDLICLHKICRSFDLPCIAIGGYCSFHSPSPPPTPRRQHQRARCARSPGSRGHLKDSVNDNSEPANPADPPPSLPPFPKAALPSLFMSK